MHDRLTTIIPTRNRPAFLRRLLHFMRRHGERSQIEIVDSSSYPARSSNERTVADHAGQLTIGYRHMEAGMVPKCRRMVELVETPYTVFCADDDFLLPASVHAALDFLEASPEYSCAQGIMASFCTDKQNKCYAAPCYSIEDDRVARRFSRMASLWYSTFYSVTRTPLLVRAWQVTDEETDNDRARIFPEILLTQMSVLQGKAKFLPMLYNLREEHGANESAVVPWVADRKHSCQLYQAFREVTARELAAFGGLALDQARSLVDRYYGYLKDGGIVYAQRKRAVWNKIRRELTRQCRRVGDLVWANGIYQRRRIRASDRLCDNPEWKLAMETMLRYPGGIHDRDQTAA